MAKLLKILKKNNILLIIKLHYLVKNDVNFTTAKMYENHPNILFWDNKKDIYEIFDQIDLGILDYSSIYYDMLASGVKSLLDIFMIMINIWKTEL